MMSIPAWEIWLVLALQDAGPWLRPIMEGFTLAGNPQAYMIIIAIIYWEVDRKLGLRMAVFLPISACVTGLLKQLIHAPRPFWVNPGISAIRPSGGFGMPSGHAMSSTVWLLAAAYLKKGWFWILMIFLVFGVGLSRVYLGVHFMGQVLAGWGIGLLLVICYLRLEPVIVSRILRLRLTWSVFIIIAFTAVIILLGYIFISLLGGWEIPPEWIRNASEFRHIDKAGLISYGMASVAGNAGGFAGVTLGALLMERAGKFSSGGAWWIRLLRVLVGLAGMALVYTVFEVFDPGDRGLLIKSLWRFLGYFLISFSALYILPLLFIRLKLLEMKG
jgi:membrane-associated phospholipid phosphatase